jgi:CBS-domain-containing membrane protein
MTEKRDEERASSHGRGFRPPPDMTEEDVLAAMKAIPGYLDISPGDFRELYALAFAQARERVLSVQAVKVMTREVIAVTEKSPLDETARTLSSRAISGVPVLDADGRVGGVVSEKDFLRRMGGGDGFMELVARCMSTRGCPAIPVRGRTAGDIMSAPAVTAPRDAPIHEILDIMSTHGINRVPVVDDAGRPEGIVTGHDLVRALSSMA